MTHDHQQYLAEVKAFNEGYRAADLGYDVEDNPYEDKVLRKQWYDGFNYSYRVKDSEERNYDV
jgi:ribosome modulation factor